MFHNLSEITATRDKISLRSKEYYMRMLEAYDEELGASAAEVLLKPTSGIIPRRNIFTSLKFANSLSALDEISL